MRQPYRYLALRKGDTRIVVLQPDKDYDAEICVGLAPLTIEDRVETLVRQSTGFQRPSKRAFVATTHNNDSHDAYEALSYCWGHGLRETSICCDGCDLLISNNLFQALRRLRYPDRARRLWIDAISINQSDDEEKSEQVSMMARIFRDSDRGLIWLGDDPNEVDMTCMRFFQKAGSMLADFDRTDADNIIRHRVMVERVAEEVFVAGTGSADASARRASTEVHMPRELEAFFQTPWFGRRWVVQELFAPRTSTVVFGSHTMVWGVLSDVCRLYLGLEDYRIQHLYHSWPEVAANGPESKCMNRAKHLFMLDPGYRFGSILDYLEAFSTFECADDRDRVNSLLSLRNPGINADYGMSVEETYIELAVNRVQAGQTRRLLDCALRRVTFEKERSLPSWVPDWRVRTFPVLFVDPTFDYDKNGASYLEGRPARLSADQRGLIISAQIRDIIYRVDYAASSFPASNVITFSGARRKMCRRFGMFRDGVDAKVSQDSVPEIQAGDLIAHYSGSESFVLRPVSVSSFVRADGIGRVRLLGLCHEPDGSNRTLSRPDEDAVAFVLGRMFESGLMKPFVTGSADSRGSRSESGEEKAVKLLDGVPFPTDPERLVELMIV